MGKGFNPEVPSDAVWGDVGYVIPALRSARAKSLRRLIVSFVALTIAVVAIFVALFLWLSTVSTPAGAHMKHHPELSEWLRTLYSRRSPCCDGTDAETLADPDWKLSTDAKECLASEPWMITEEFHICIRLQKPNTDQWDWWQVPDSALVNIPNRAGPALYWLYWAASGKPFIRCFLPGTMS